MEQHQTGFQGKASENGRRGGERVPYCRTLAIRREGLGGGYPSNRAGPGISRATVETAPRSLRR